MNSKERQEEGGKEEVRRRIEETRGKQKGGTEGSMAILEVEKGRKIPLGAQVGLPYCAIARSGIKIPKLVRVYPKAPNRISVRVVLAQRLRRVSEIPQFQRTVRAS